MHNGNERVAIAAVQAARDLGQLHRVILGTDSPAGSGVQPLGILRMISLLSSFGGIPAAQAFAMATGNTARIRNLDAGLIEPGRAADWSSSTAPSTAPGGTCCTAWNSATCPASAG